MSSKKPAFVKGFLWFSFSGTAMLSAFILPIHVWAVMTGRWMSLEFWWQKTYLMILVAAALYHSYYRVKTVAFDLTLVKLEKVLEVLLGVMFVGLMAWLGIELFFF